MDEQRTIVIEMDVPRDVTAAELEEAIQERLDTIRLPGGEVIEPTIDGITIS